MKLTYAPLLLLLAACGLTGGDSATDVDVNRLHDGDNAGSAECRECAAAVEQCLVNGGECIEIFIVCEGICFGLPEPEPEPPSGDCELELQVCLESAGGSSDDIDECFQRFEECITAPSDEPAPPACEEHCAISHGECLASGTSEQECAAQADACFLGCQDDEPEEPIDPACDACFDTLLQCVDEAGEDQAAIEECERQDEACWLEHCFN